MHGTATSGSCDDDLSAPPPHQENYQRSITLNHQLSSLDMTSPLSLSTIRALSIPITPGTVKSKRDLITKNSPDSLVSSSMHSNRCPSPSTISTTEAKTIKRLSSQWNMNPPFSTTTENSSILVTMRTDINVHTTNNNDDLDTLAPLKALKESDIHCTSPHSKRTLRLEEKWPPRSKGKSDVVLVKTHSTTKTPKTLEVSNQVKSLRSHFECSPGTGTPLAFRMAQEMFQRLSPTKTPKSTAAKDQYSISRIDDQPTDGTIQNQSSSLTDEEGSKSNMNVHMGARTILLRQALENATHIVSEREALESSIPCTAPIDIVAEIEKQSLPQSTHKISSVGKPLTVDPLEEETPIQDRLPVQEHFADIVLPSGQKLPPPKGRQKHRRTNYRIRYEGPTLLRLEDVYGQLLDIPEVDDRFLAEPKDSMATLPKRRSGQSPPPVRGKRPDMIGKTKCDSAPVRPGRQHYDSDSDSVFSACSSDLLSVFTETEDSNEEVEESKQVPNDHNGSRAMNRPDVWITPIKAGNRKRRWKVKRMWNVEDVDDEEDELSVDHEDLMDTIKSLLGVPEHFGHTSEEWDVKIDAESPWEIDGEKDSAPWYLKRVYDIDGEIESSDEDDEEISLSTGHMTEAMKNMFDSNDNVYNEKSHMSITPSGKVLVVTGNISSHIPFMSEQNGVDPRKSIYAYQGAAYAANEHELPIDAERKSVQSFVGSNDCISTVRTMVHKSNRDVLIQECSEEEKKSVALYCNETASGLVITGHDPNPPLHQSNTPKLDGDFHPSTNIMNRRHSTGDIPDKNMQAISESKQGMPEVAHKKNTDFSNTSPVKARCSSLHTPGRVAKPKKEIKMWWHE